MGGRGGREGREGGVRHQGPFEAPSIKHLVPCRVEVLSSKFDIRRPLGLWFFGV